MSKSCTVTLFVFIAVLSLTNAIPLRSLFLRSYDDMNPESVPARGYFDVVNLNDVSDAADNRPKRGLDLLKRRVEIIERNRCFFNPITCY